MAENMLRTSRQKQQPAAVRTVAKVAFRRSFPGDICDVHLSLVQVDAGAEPHSPSLSSSSSPSSCARRVRHFTVQSSRTRGSCELGSVSGICRLRTSWVSTNTLSFFYAGIYLCEQQQLRRMCMHLAAWPSSSKRLRQQQQ